MYIEQCQCVLNEDNRTIGFSLEKLPPQRVMRGHPGRFVRTRASFCPLSTNHCPLFSLIIDKFFQNPLVFFLQLRYNIY